jgi:alkylated DNA repair protein alkB homolog 1
MVKSTVRTRILVPGDEVPKEDFYSERSGPEARVPLNRTAFREAERKYKGTTVDLSQVYDFSNKEALKSDVIILGYWRRSDGVELEIYGIEGVEGFKFVSGAMTCAEQVHFMKQSFIEYPRKPNSTNLDAHFEVPTEGLFSYFKDQIECSILNKSTQKRDVYDWKSLEERFIRKIRWITLGYQYNWTTKEYNFDEKDSNATFPEDLAIWTRDAVKQLGFTQEYRPEAGIVNFYQLDDTLTGHVDRSEKNMDAPLVSLSIGLSAIFLLGGLNRDDEPVRAILVRSGDLSILSGPTRLCFHGVPKILPEPPLIDFKIENNLRDDENLEKCLDLMKNCRININVRQVL